ncbi:MAG TPA: type II secretion system F family protein, partial [Armatimonadota bacterium]|nr:type II secretion system F family protein [Armatimonadota bacterium]
MTEFRYTALDDHGREVTGALQAENRPAALARLKSMGMYPTEVAAGAAGGGAAVVRGSGVAAPVVAEVAAPRAPLFPKRVSASDVALFTRQLASLFNAGLNMARSLDTLIDHADNATLKAALVDVRQAVQSGSSLWEAMAEHPRIFPELYVSLVQAGEASGQLGKVLERLADSLEMQGEQQSRVRSALAYPFLLMGAGLSAVLFILLFLVPRFSKIFAGLKKELPAPTKMLLALQGFLSSHGWIVLVVAVGVVLALRAWDRSEQGGLVLDRLRMRMWL